MLMHQIPLISNYKIRSSLCCFFPLPSIYNLTGKKASLERAYSVLVLLCNCKNLLNWLSTAHCWVCVCCKTMQMHLIQNSSKFRSTFFFFLHVKTTLVAPILTPKDKHRAGFGLRMHSSSKQPFKLICPLSFSLPTIISQFSFFPLHQLFIYLTPLWSQAIQAQIRCWRMHSCHRSNKLFSSVNVS